MHLPAGRTFKAGACVSTGPWCSLAGTVNNSRPAAQVPGLPGGLCTAADGYSAGVSRRSVVALADHGRLSGPARCARDAGHLAANLILEARSRRLTTSRRPPIPHDHPFPQDALSRYSAVDPVPKISRRFSSLISGACSRRMPETSLKSRSPWFSRCSAPDS